MPVEIGVTADLDLKQWDNSIREMQRDADRVDSILGDVVDSINDVERAANSVDVDIKPTLDDSQLKDGLDVINDVKSDLARLDGETASPRIEPEGENTLNDIKGTLDEIAAYQKFTFIWNFLTNLDDIVTAIEQIPGLGGLIELERAGAQFAAQTGQNADAVENLIVTLRTGDNAIIGTRDEVAQLAATVFRATQNFETLEADTRAVNDAMQITGYDAAELTSAAQQLVDVGLAENLTEASAIIVTGFQEGLDVSGDFLDTLREYGQEFVDLGLDAEGALSVLSSGLQSGFDNTDRVADALREMQIKVNEAGDSINGFGQEFEDAATAAGVLDEAIAFRSGQITGEQYLNAVTEGLSAIADEGERAAAATALIGTQAEDFGVEGITALETDRDLGDLETRTQAAADVIHDTLSQTLAEVSQEIDQAFVEILDAANVDEWIDGFRGRLDTFLTEIRAGRSFPEALQIALEAPGLTEAIQRFESVAGNLVIGFLQVSETFLRATGQGGAADIVARQIASMSEAQLTFDLNAAQLEEDAQGAIQAALSRGVSFDDIQEGIRTAYATAIEEGNLDAARAIADAAAQTTFVGAGGQRENVILDTSLIETAAAQATEAFDAAIAAGDFGGAQLIADNLGTDLRTELARAVAEQDFGLAAILANQLGGSEGVELQSVVASALAAGLSEEAITEILTNAQGVVDGTTTMSEEVVTAGDEITTSLQDAGVAFEDFETIAIARSQGADLAFSAFADNVGYKAAEAAGALSKLEDVWTRLTLSMGGNLALPGGAGGGGNTTNNNSNVTVNVNQTNNGGAAATAGGNQVSNWVRGQ